MQWVIRVKIRKKTFKKIKKKPWKNLNVKEGWEIAPKKKKERKKRRMRERERYWGLFFTNDREMENVLFFLQTLMENVLDQ